MFLDEAEVEFASGRGGNGAATFHREKHVPRGGPNGADGGRGGDVLLIADRAKRTLYDFKLRREIRAGDGGDAQGQRTGKHGESVEVRVPVGTVVFDTESGERLADLCFDGAAFRACKGGKGGHGNLRFVSSVRQAPKFAELGEPGENLRARLELKLLADVGLIGLPNAGKSTLLARISAARPKIADYPFTTLEPNLGIVRVGDSSFTVADLPGLIEGAHAGKGLGDRFLRHAERSATLVHVVEVLPLDESDPRSNFELVERELESFSPEVAAKPRIVALNKIDLIPASRIEELRSCFERFEKPVFPISGVSGQGVDALLYAMSDAVAAAPRLETEAVLSPEPKQDESGWSVVPENGAFRVSGKAVERMVAMTDLESDEAVRYLHRRLERLGLIQRLREMGAREGDTVLIGDREFSFTDYS